MFPKNARFSDLNADQQISVLKKIDKTEFFNLVRNHTVMGFLIDPDYGGNFNQIGWKLFSLDLPDLTTNLSGDGARIGRQ